MENKTRGARGDSDLGGGGSGASREKEEKKKPATDANVVEWASLMESGDGRGRVG